MASSREAFLKFDKWKNARTVLSFTVVKIVDGEGFADRFQGAIFFTDEDKELVSFVDDESRNHATLDLSGAFFKVTARSLEANCLDRGTVTFVEVLLV